MIKKALYYITGLLVISLSIFMTNSTNKIHAETEGDYEYDVNEITGDVTITKYLGSETNIVIPDKLGDANVVIIGRKAFENKGLTSVNLPNTIKSISNFAFKGNQLQHVELSNDLEDIGMEAFKDNALTTIDIPKSVNQIVGYAFLNNPLETVTIRSKTVTIGDWTFNSKDLTIIGYRDSTAETYANENGYSFVDIGTVPTEPIQISDNGDGTAIITDYMGTDDKIDIPKQIDGKTIVGIGNEAFANHGLTSLSIPDSVTSIGKNAFADNKITEVMIPGSVIEIGDGAFLNNRISSATIEKDVEIIGDSAFKNNQLKSVTIPLSVTKINRHAFEDNHLEKARILNYKLDILPDAFAGNQDNATDLTLYGHFEYSTYYYAQKNGYTFKSDQPEFQYALLDQGDSTATIMRYTGPDKAIKVPDKIAELTVTGIGNDAFSNQQLMNVEIPANVKTIGDRAFYGNRLESFIIPDGVKKIGKDAFYANYLKEIVFPSGITTIGEGAFRYNDLTVVTIPKSVQKLEKNIFNDRNPLTGVIIKGKNTQIDNNTFPLESNLTLFGYTDSTAETLAHNRGYRFLNIEDPFEFYFEPRGTDGEWLNKVASTQVNINAFGKPNLQYLWSDDENTPSVNAEWDTLLNGVPIDQKVNGKWYLHVRAEDKLGNTSFSHSDLFLIDQTAPKLILMMKQNKSGNNYTNDEWSNEPVHVSAEAEDEDSGIASLQITINEKEVKKVRKDNTSYDFLDDGVYELKLAAMDKAGNEARLKRIVKIDQSPPKITFEKDGSNKKQEEISTKITVEDKLSGIDENSLHYIWTEDEKSPYYDTTWKKFDNEDTLTLKNKTGKWYLHVHAKDMLGNKIINTSQAFQMYIPPSGGSGGTAPSHPSNDANLVELDIVVGEDNLIDFDPDQTEYSIETKEDEFELSATVSDSDATITVNEEIIDGNITLSLEEGVNVFEIVVTAEDGTEKEYTITINRLKEVPFQDIETHWANDYIKIAYRNDWFQGYQDGSFGPEKDLTRMQSASLFVRILGLTETSDVPFLDISSVEAETIAELEKAYANGVVNGFPNQTFRPYAYVTRAQFALMIYRTYEIVTGTVYTPQQLTDFPDISGYDKESQHAIAMLVELGIAEGDHGKFKPGNTATRAHAAKMLVNFKEVLDGL